MIRRWAAASVALACLVSAGCGRYAVRGAKGPTTTTGGNVSVGSGLTGHDETSTTAGAAAAAQSNVPPPTAPRTSGQPRSNRATSTDSGLRFVFTVGTKTTYSTQDDFPMDVTITNVSGHPLTYEPNPSFTFILGHPAGRTGAVWHDTDCMAGDEPGQNQARTLAPNQQLHLSALYPGPPDAANRQYCRRIPDDYVAGVVFVLCDRVYDASGKCDTSSFRYVKSLGILTTLT
jgi:hypothetical protein